MSKRQRKARLPDQPVRVTIESLAHDGRGVARVEGKTVFVDGALPGEEVSFLYTRRARKHDEGRVSELHSVSVHRVEPKCAAFAICGGCSLQHLAPEQQILAKQQTLLDNLQRIGKVEPAGWLEPLGGPVWHYRRRARLAVKDVYAKERVLVGFRERHAPFITDMHRCEVLAEPASSLIGPLSDMIGKLSIRARLPQIEVAVADNAVALVFRVLDAPTDEDVAVLTAFAREQGVRVYLQPGGPDTVQLLWPQQSSLSYHLPALDVEIRFRPTDFTQVNTAINEQMIERVLQLLALQQQDQVLDLFCGLGNFTLPMARLAGAVTGVEGEAGLLPFPVAEPADARGQPLEGHPVLCLAGPAGQSLVLGEQLGDDPVGDRVGAHR